jgi:hypothetical protein
LPAEPQTVDDCAGWATHLPCESQQPFGQVVWLQAHFPAVVSQVWPVAQAAHAAPAVPHVAVDWPACATQVPFAWQQPLGQEAGVQAHFPVASQVWPVAQAAQAPPALPHI